MSHADLLSENNACGQTLLRLSARGNAIIAELLRLSKNLPAPFTGEDTRYEPVLVDFRYIDTSESFEARIDADEMLSDLDSELRENFMPLLERFYNLFEAVFKFSSDWRKFLEDLSEGLFIHETFDRLLVNNDGKQLMAECQYLLGVMLLLMDSELPSLIRERMIISYFRYKGSNETSNSEEVFKLCRGTGYVKGRPFPRGYPEEYFARVSPDTEIVDMLIGRLRSDDIYQQSSHYPSPHHRSAALAGQAGMLYILLYFSPRILHKQQAAMREIVDRFHPDCFVESYFMGFTVDLSEVWMPYRAATLALENTLEPSHIREMIETNVERERKCLEELNHYLTEGILTEEYVLDNVNRLLNCLRNCNVCLRWWLLHRTTTKKNIAPLILAASSAPRVLELLLNTAQFEYILRNLFDKLLEEKKDKWDLCKNEAGIRMKELSDFFSGEQLLSARNKDEQLKNWFADIATKIKDLDYEDFTLAGRKIQELIRALEEVEQFHQVESSLQVKQHLADTRDFLRKMIRYVNVRDEVVQTIEQVGDISYAWHVIVDYVPVMQSVLRRTPEIVIKLRSAFLKLASMMDLPTIRIQQCNSNDLESVCNFYSCELIAFVRRVMEIVPKTMFQLLTHIIHLQTGQLEELPTKLPRDQMRRLAQLEVRFDLAQHTFEVSKFTEGILAMETTLMGVIELDPKKLLEDGIRKELVRQIAEAMDEALVFRHTRAGDFEVQLNSLANRLRGMFTSFEYIQDFINVYGLKMWQEEFSRIINYHVEMECNRFLRTKVLDFQSKFQSDVIPIPRFPLIDGSNFMGRLTREVLLQTDPRRTVYVEPMSAWFEGNQEIVGIKTFSLIQDSVGVYGLSGMDRLLCFMLVDQLQQYCTLYEKNVTGPLLGALRGTHDTCSSPSVLSEQSVQLLSTISSRSGKLFQTMSATITFIGQAQLIRRQISNELNFLSKLDSTTLACALDAANAALVSDVRAHYRKPDMHPYPAEDNPLLSDLTEYLANTGMDDPLCKIYITHDALEELPILLAALTVSQIVKFNYDPATGSLVCRNPKEGLDGGPFVTGLSTLLHQFHKEHTEVFLMVLAQYIKTQIVHVNYGSKESRAGMLPAEAFNLLVFFDNFCKLSHFPRKAIEDILPPFVFDFFLE